MSKQVKITVTGIHKDAAGGKAESEEITKSYPGTLKRIGDVWYVRYEEVEEGRTESTKTLLKLQPGQMELVKKGAAASNLLMKRGQRTAGSYGSLFGTFSVVVNTSYVYLEVDEEIIEAQTAYVLEMDGQPVSEAKLKIRIEPAEA